MKVRLIVTLLCIVASVAGLHTEDSHVETKRHAHGSDVIEVVPIHSMKRDGSEDAKVVRHGVANAGETHVHAVLKVNDKVQPVRTKPELHPVKTMKNDKKGLDTMPKLVTSPGKPGKGGRRKNNKRPNRRNLKGKRMNIKTSKNGKKRLNMRPKLVSSAGRPRTGRRKNNRRKNRKNKTGKRLIAKNKKPRNKQRQMRKLKPTGAHRAMLESIIAAHKKGQGSKISTNYLKERIRALLKDQSLFKPNACKTDKKAKAKKTKKANKRKSLRKLTPRKRNENKRPLKKTKKLAAKKRKNVLNKQNMNTKEKIN